MQHGKKNCKNGLVPWNGRWFMKILLRAGLKKQWQSVMTIGILFMLMTISIITAITIRINSSEYIMSEMRRAGFGDETVWISMDSSNSSYHETIEGIVNEISSMDEVENVKAQQLVFSGYSVGNQRSDDEGQLISYQPENVEYKFLSDDLSEHVQIENIRTGEIYVSPTFSSNFNASIGDTVSFRLSRNGESRAFKIAGYFEDPFMGSSMIDMKSFLICKEDFESIVSAIQKANSFQVLGRAGAMLHVTQKADAFVNASELSGRIQSNEKISRYVEFSYSNGSMEGFMMILQNILAGFLVVFAIILGIISVLIIGHSISNSIEQDYRDMGILKMIGGDSILLRKLQMIQYGIGMLTGFFVGIAASFVLSNTISSKMTTFAGLKIPSHIPVIFLSMIFAILLLGFLIFIYFKTKKIMDITPVKAMKGKIEIHPFVVGRNKIHFSTLSLNLSLRQIGMNKKKYVGIVIVSMLLSILLVIVGKMNLWLGPNGEGLMDSFSVAEHDIGVQPNHSINLEQVDDVIGKYAEVTDTYELAMQRGTVNGVAYTLNVLDEPEWYHIVSGRTCETDEEILVTEYVASDLGIKTGDSVTVGSGTKSAKYSVVGIYSCANEMGANVGMTKEGYARIGDVTAFIWCHHYVLSNSEHNETIMKELQSLYPMDLDVHTNSWSGLSGIVNIMHLLTIVMLVIVLIVIVVGVILTISKLIQTEQRDMAILESIGLTIKSIRFSFMLRFLIAAGIGIFIGGIISGFFGDLIVNALLSSFGISDFYAAFSVVVNLLGPVFVMCLFSMTAYLYAVRIKKLDVIELIKDN